MITLYGIKNCDTMKKAFQWLDEHGLEYTFHDYKKAGVSQEHLKLWARTVGWRSLINTRGTTWRSLPPEEQTDLSPSKAIQLMVRHPSLIRRPVLVVGEQIVLGFDPAVFVSVLRPYLTEEPKA